MQWRGEALPVCVDANNGCIYLAARLVYPILSPSFLLPPPPAAVPILCHPFCCAGTTAGRAVWKVRSRNWTRLKEHCIKISIWGHSENLLYFIRLILNIVLYNFLCCVWLLTLEKCTEYNNLKYNCVSVYLANSFLIKCYFTISLTRGIISNIRSKTVLRLVFHTLLHIVLVTETIITIVILVIPCKYLIYSLSCMSGLQWLLHFYSPHVCSKGEKKVTCKFFYFLITFFEILNETVYDFLQNTEILWQLLFPWQKPTISPYSFISDSETQFWSVTILCFFSRQALVKNFWK